MKQIGNSRKWLLWAALGIAASLEAAGGVSSRFIANKGQWDPSVRFLARKGNMNVWITGDGVTYDLYASSYSAAMTPLRRASEAPAGLHGHVIRFKWANPAARAEGIDRLPGCYNYFIGNDPTRWRTSVPLFGEVKAKDVFEGVDARFYDEDGMVRYDLIVRPHASVEAIELEVEGAERLSVDPATGDLLIGTSLGTIRHRGLHIYQPTEQGEQAVAGRFKVKGNRIGFEVAAYDPDRPLIIDPLVYSTFIGHSADEAAKDLTTNAAGEAYITGYTASANYPTTAGAYDVSHNGGLDIFVTKLNSAGSALVFSTFVGGTADEEGTSIVLDGSGNVYVCGWTESTNFPTVNAYDNSHNGGKDAVVLKLNSTGTALSYSTYLGGSAEDFAWAVKIAGTNEAVVTGYTASSNFPTTTGAYDVSHNGNNDAFLTRLAGGGNSLTYSTFLGGSGDDRAFDVVLDGGNNPYVVGYTASTNFPTTTGAYDQSHNGGTYDGFISKLTNTAGGLTYSTFLGGNGADIIWSAALEASGNIVTAGATLSTNFPTVNAYQNTHGGGTADGILSKLNSTGSSLIYSTYFGGSGWDEAYSVVLDAIGTAYATGYTTSTDFDVTTTAYDQTHNGGNDGFIFRLDNTGNTSSYGSYLGGLLDDEIWRGLLLSGGDFLMAGYTFSSDFPTVTGSYDITHNGARDAFVTKLGGPLVPVTLVYFKGTCADRTVSFHWATASERHSHQFIIEKRQANEWTPVAAVKAAGTSTEWREYFYALPAPQREPAAYYRLVQEDIDGKRTIFDPIAVLCGTSPDDVLVYPNPSDGVFHIVSPSNDYTHVHLYDAAGRSWGYAPLSHLNRPTRLLTSAPPTGRYYLVLSGPHGSTTIPVSIR